jgi:hypothetical protein
MKALKDAKKKGQLKQEEAVEKAVEKKSVTRGGVGRRRFGDYRFDYLKSCKHDLGIDNAVHYSKASLEAAEGTTRGSTSFLSVLLFLLF